MTINIDAPAIYQYILDVPEIERMEPMLQEIEVVLLQGKDAIPEGLEEHQMLAELSDRIHTLIETKILPFIALAAETKSKVENGELDANKEISEEHAVIVLGMAEALLSETLMKAIAVAAFLQAKG